MGLIFIISRIEVQKWEKTLIQKKKISVRSKKEQFKPFYCNVSKAKDWIRKSRIQTLLNAKQNNKDKKIINSKLDLQINYTKEYHKKDAILILKDSKLLEKGKLDQNTLIVDDLSKKEKDSFSIEPTKASLNLKDLKKNSSKVDYQVDEHVCNEKDFELSHVDIQENFLKSISVKKKLEQAEKLQENNSKDCFDYGKCLTRKNISNFKKRKKKVY